MLFKLFILRAPDSDKLFDAKPLVLPQCQYLNQVSDILSRLKSEVLQISHLVPGASGLLLKITSLLAPSQNSMINWSITSAYILLPGFQFGCKPFWWCYILPTKNKTHSSPILPWHPFWRVRTLPEGWQLSTLKDLTRVRVRVGVDVPLYCASTQQLITHSIESATSDILTTWVQWED